MKLKVLGTGDAFSEENTCFILEADKKYLIDFPKNISLLEDNINDVILTHTHPDHIGDILTFIMKKYIEKSPLNIYTKKEVYDNLVGIIDKTGTLLEKLDSQINRINLIELRTNEKYNRNGLEIEARDNYTVILNTGELIPSIGLKFKYKNASLAYSGDCKYSKEFIEKLYAEGKINDKQKEDALGFLWNADFIIHEATSIESPFHTYINELEKLPENIKSKLHLAHFPDDLKTGLKKLEKGQVHEIK